MAAGSTSAASANADAYLSVKTKRAGTIKGESRAPEHEDAIAIQGWSWGVVASSAMGSTQATGRRSYKNLMVCKRLDSSTTALMSVLVTNDEVKEAKLSLRKAGEGQRDFFTITLSNARVTSVDLECDEQGDTLERVTFAFNKVVVDYEIQQGSGQRGSGFSFQDELIES